MLVHVTTRLTPAANETFDFLMLLSRFSVLFGRSVSRQRGPEENNQTVSCFMLSLLLNFLSSKLLFC